MVTIDDFPDEILQTVISRIYQARDIANLSLVSRRLCHLVRGAPSYENSKLYRRLNFDDFHSLSTFKGYSRGRLLLYSSLVSFLTRPNLALYVDTVILKWDCYSEHDFYFELTNEEKTTLLELIFKRTGILDWEAGTEFVVALEEDRLEAYFALLLLLLGNLEVLHINLSDDDKWVRWAITRALPYNLFPTYLTSGFRRLRHVEITWKADYRSFYSETISLSSIAPFLLLPSIDFIEATMVRQDEDFKWTWPYGKSTITTLSFLQSDISVRALDRILSIPRALHRFEYRYIDEAERDHDNVVELLKLKGIPNSVVQNFDPDYGWD